LKVFLVSPNICILIQSTPMLPSSRAIPARAFPLCTNGNNLLRRLARILGSKHSFQFLHGALLRLNKEEIDDDEQQQVQHGVKGVEVIGNAVEGDLAGNGVDETSNTGIEAEEGDASGAHLVFQHLC
jgi:hypothetical protein